MARDERWGKLGEIAGNPELGRVLIDHAYRGIRVQFMLRGVLVVFIALVVILVPVAHYRWIGYLIAALYLLSTLVLLVVTRRAKAWLVRYIWLALYIDVVALGSLCVLDGVAASDSWSADILLNGFFLLPVMAATQLRPWVCLSVCVPTSAVYLFCSVVTRVSNDEPWVSLWLRTGVFVGLATGCVLLCRVQQSRVLTIASHVFERGALLADMVGIESRERQALAEHLHDGALQYVLAARHDLADARDAGDAGSFERLDHALSESAQLLRATVTGLHPAVLEQAGLRHAVEELAARLTARGAFNVETDTQLWPKGVKTSADDLLYATARELLRNVLKHADASQVRVTLALRDGTAGFATGHLTVSDDGRGLPESALEERLAAGHIGIASRRIRLEAAGGVLVLRAGEPRGTHAEASVPVEVSVPAAGASVPADAAAPAESA
ncbi:sensor histidine kinase [Rathayibacter soli]|uniref:sensor histidine kinase n=1 Tax=Rathayibacter soli TaxID=3144168 RepID=UPI0027E3C770|nr:ATP-binding protein [Glaciibacter superstes]